MKLLEVLQGLDYEVLKGNTDPERFAKGTAGRSVFLYLWCGIRWTYICRGCGCEGCSRDRRGKAGKCARHRDGDPCEEYPVCDG